MSERAPEPTGATRCDCVRVGDVGPITHLAITCPALMIHARTGH